MELNLMRFILRTLLILVLFLTEILVAASATSTTNCHTATSKKGQLVKAELEAKLSSLISQLEELNQNYKFDFKLEDETLSESLFSTNLWKGFRIQIDARQSPSLKVAVPYITLSLVHYNDKSVLIENLESHSISKPNPKLFFGSTINQENHKGMGLKEFQNLKKWLSDYLKDVGYSSIISNDQSSYTVSRFYRFIGMKPVEPTVLKIDDYLSHLLRESKQLGLEEIKKMEDISRFLNSNSLPSLFLDSLENFYSNFKTANSTEQAKLETSFKTLIDDSGQIKDFEFIKDSQNKLIGVRGTDENRRVVLFFAPDFLIEKNGSSILTWNKLPIASKKLILTL